MQNKVPELLCPAGSREGAMAALCAGADALYLGASAFGARANAGFSEEELKEVLEACHLRGRRVYVTVNTLIKENELADVRQTLQMLQRLKVDAVLVQDLGVLRLIQEEMPDLCVHASTQMAVHNASGARLLQGLGVRRVVLARECTLEEIRCVADTGIETEVFVHGAQCVSVSGQCRFSGLIGGRSGNRGRCAQPCRMRYDWQGENKAWLSPKDICLRDRLKELAEAGVSTLKIEGRLKRPEYTAVVTRSYREALDALGEGRFYRADEAEKERLSQVFSRGFFEGYAFEDRDAAMMQPERVAAMGVSVGTVTHCTRRGGVWLAEMKAERPIHNGDGLQLRGEKEQDIIYSGPQVPQGTTAVLRLHGPVPSGTAVVRIDDEALLESARNSWQKKNALPDVPFDAVLTAQPGEAACLRVTSGGCTAEVTGETVQTASGAPLNEEKLCRALSKTADTGFALNSASLVGENAFLTASELNSLRRNALEKLRERLLDAYEPQKGAPAEKFSVPTETPKKDLWVQTIHAAWVKDLLDNGADGVLWQPQNWTEPALSQALDVLPRETVVVLPVQMTEESLQTVLEPLHRGGFRICVSSPGQLTLEGAVMSGEGVPVWNGKASEMIRELGCGLQILPRELSGMEIDELRRHTQAQLLLPVYGRARLMYLNHCPARTVLGLQGDRSACRLCEKGRGCLGQTLTDRTGKRFPLLPLRQKEGCLVQLLSCEVRQLKPQPGLGALLDFTTEGKEDALRILAEYRSGNASAVYAERFDRGVE